MALNNIFSRLDKIESMLRSVSKEPEEKADSELSSKIESIESDFVQLYDKLKVSIADMDTKTTNSFTQMGMLTQQLSNKVDDNLKECNKKTEELVSKSNSIEKTMKDLVSKSEFDSKIKQLVEKTNELDAKMKQFLAKIDELETKIKTPSE
jgi:DNA repair ATPase RecN